MKDRLLKIREVAARLNCTPTYVYNLLREDMLPAIRFSERMTRIPERGLDAFIKSKKMDAEDYFK